MYICKYIVKLIFYCFSLRVVSLLKGLKKRILGMIFHLKEIFKFGTGNTFLGHF